LYSPFSSFAASNDALKKTLPFIEKRSIFMKRFCQHFSGEDVEYFSHNLLPNHILYYKTFVIFYLNYLCKKLNSHNENGFKMLYA